jgi:hypothetical protein
LEGVEPPPYEGLRLVGATLELLSQPLRKACLDDKNRILYLNDTILIEGIPEAAFAYRVGTTRLCAGLASISCPLRMKKRAFGGPRAFDFLDRELITFSERALAIRRELDELFAENQV